MKMLFSVYYDECPNERISYTLFSPEFSSGRIVMRSGFSIVHSMIGNHTSFQVSIEDEMYQFKSYKEMTCHI
jgi:hypothetical protein